MLWLPWQFVQIEWQFVAVHIQTVLRVSLEESTMVALICDDIQRRAWSRRAAKGDASLDLLVEASCKCQQTVETARSKVKLVARASGLSSASPSDHGPGSVAVDLGNAEAAISKQVAMAQQITKQAEAAMSRMNNHKPGAQQTFRSQQGTGKGGYGKQGKRPRGGSQSYGVGKTKGAGKQYSNKKHKTDW